MANCYIHTERQASSSCVICGRAICRECSNWAAGDIYLCPRCWQENAPAPPTPEKAKREGPAPRPFGGLARVLYYAVAFAIVLGGAWYAYVNFIAPAILPSGGPPTFQSPAPSSLGEIWSRYNLLITVSVSMLIIVLVGGELMLRTGPKQPQAIKTQPAVQQAIQPTPPKSTPAVLMQTQVVPQRITQRQDAPATHPETKPRTQPPLAEPKPSQRAVAQPQVQPSAQVRLVYCIYCGNKILPTATFCNRCGKGQN